jgi:membrane-associated protein
MAHVQRRGGVIVFVGRWTSILRAVVPAVAGTSRMEYGRFLVSNVLGGVAWAAVFTLAGYAAGESYRSVEAATGRGGWIVAAALGGWLALRLLVRRRRGQRNGAPDEVCCAPGAEPDLHDGVVADDMVVAADIDAAAQVRPSAAVGDLVEAGTS